MAHIFIVPPMDYHLHGFCSGFKGRLSTLCRSISGSRFASCLNRWCVYIGHDDEDSCML